MNLEEALLLLFLIAHDTNFHLPLANHVQATHQRGDAADNELNESSIHITELKHMHDNELSVKLCSCQRSALLYAHLYSALIRQAK